MHIVPDLLARVADLSPAAPAMRDLVTGVRRDYAAFSDAASRAAAVLAAEGVGEGDRVGVLCRNRLEFFDALFAAARLGAVAVPLNWRMPARELAGILDDCAPKTTLVGAEDADKLPSGRAAA